MYGDDRTSLTNASLKPRMRRKVNFTTRIIKESQSEKKHEALIFRRAFTEPEAGVTEKEISPRLRRLHADNMRFWWIEFSL